MTEELLAKLIAYLEAAAPELWEIAYRQVYVNLVGNILGALLCIAAMYGLFKLFKYLQSNQENSWDDYDMAKVFIIVGIVALAIIVAFPLSTIPGYLINPKWYAIKNIIGLMP